MLTKALGVFIKQVLIQLNPVFFNIQIERTHDPFLQVNRANFRLFRIQPSNSTVAAWSIAWWRC